MMLDANPHGLNPTSLPKGTGHVACEAENPGVADMALMFAFCRANERLTGHMDRLLQEHDLSCSQYHVLRILAQADPDPLTCGGIGGRMPQEAPDVTRLADRLCKRDLLWRRHSERDRRVVMIGLTDAGRALAGDLEKLMGQAARRLWGHLASDEVAALRRLIERLGEAPATDDAKIGPNDSCGDPMT
jgi:DNA-binding MarR family transcriptional regulator